MKKPKKIKQPERLSLAEKEIQIEEFSKTLGFTVPKVWAKLPNERTHKGYYFVLESQEI